MVDNAMLYHTGTFYPVLVPAPTYPTLGFGQYPGEVGTAPAATDEMKTQAVQDATAALAEPLEAFHGFFLEGRQFVGGDQPSIADIRWAATLEFLRAIDYDLPDWAEDYLSRMEETLGDAYSEPAADVRGYVESVKAPAQAELRPLRPPAAPAGTARRAVRPARRSACRRGRARTTARSRGPGRRPRSSRWRRA